MDKKEGNDRYAYFINFKFSNLWYRLLLINCHSCFRLSAKRKGKIQIHLRRSGLHVFGAHRILNRFCKLIDYITRRFGFRKNININSHVRRISRKVRPENRLDVTLHDINLFNRFYDRHNASKCRTTDLIQFKFNRQFVLIVITSDRRTEKEFASFFISQSCCTWFLRNLTPRLDHPRRTRAGKLSFSTTT